MRKVCTEAQWNEVPLYLCTFMYLLYLDCTSCRYRSNLNLIHNFKCYLAGGGQDAGVMPASHLKVQEAAWRKVGETMSNRMIGDQRFESANNFLNNVLRGCLGRFRRASESVMGTDWQTDPRRDNICTSYKLWINSIESHSNNRKTCLRFLL